MQKQIGSLMAACLLLTGLGFAGSSTAAAQDQTANAANGGGTPPPNVLVIEREFLKPGMSGSPHVKSESAFVQAMKQANSPTHYFAVDSLSGKTRALFLLGYNSFADWGKDMHAMESNPTLAQQFDSAQQADGKLLSDFDVSVFVYQPDKSKGGVVNVGQMKFWEITRIKLRVGHQADWDALVKLHDSIYGNMPNAHWHMFNKVYGTDSGTLVIVFTPLKSLAELDANRAAEKQARSAAGDQLKQMNTLAASVIESIETNLFAVNPKMSYPADNWKAADPGFWGQQ